MKYRSDAIAFLLVSSVAVFALWAMACGNSLSRGVNGGIEVTEHRMLNGVTCYTAQLGDSVSIDCK